MARTLRRGRATLRRAWAVRGATGVWIGTARLSDTPGVNPILTMMATAPRTAGHVIDTATAWGPTPVVRGRRSSAGGNTA